MKLVVTEKNIAAQKIADLLGVGKARDAKSVFGHIIFNGMAAGYYGPGFHDLFITAPEYLLHYAEI